jgi:hypothetical protein
MAIWLIRYQDRFGHARSIYHEQAWRPSEDEALIAVQRSLMLAPGDNQQLSRPPKSNLFGVVLQGIDEVPRDSLAG